MPETGPWLNQDEQKAWRALLKGHTSLISALDRELMHEHELGLPDYAVLVTLSEAPQKALRMTELAKVVLLSPSGLTRRLDGLVKTGMVERRPCPSDGRGLLAVLTESGLARLQEAAPTHVRGVREHFLNKLSPDQVAQLTEIFSVVDTSERDLEAGLESACGENADEPVGEIVSTS